MPPHSTFSNSNMRLANADDIGQIRYIEGMCCVSFYFKLARTCETKVYNIPTEWNIRTMILNVQTWAKRDFPGLTSAEERDIEVVIAGQNVQGFAEDAPPLVEETISVKQKFSNVYGCTAFYLRQNVVQEEPSYVNNAIPNVDPNPNPIGEVPNFDAPFCSICFDSSTTHCYFQCTHRICRTCNDSCVARSHNTCPECRGPRL
uniref:RING-type domain-containing protein n=1 Tax=viral metagenome TaxID=1070528 RepID=A0A6C0F2Q5_9ZZZZ